VCEESGQADIVSAWPWVQPSALSSRTDKARARVPPRGFRRKLNYRSGRLEIAGLVAGQAQKKPGRPQVALAPKTDGQSHSTKIGPPGLPQALAGLLAATCGSAIFPGRQRFALVVVQAGRLPALTYSQRLRVLVTWWKRGTWPALNPPTLTLTFARSNPP